MNTRETGSGAPRQLFRTAAVQYHTLREAELLFARKPSRRDQLSRHSAETGRASTGRKAINKARCLSVAHASTSDRFRNRHPDRITPPLFAVRRNRDDAIHMILPTSAFGPPHPSPISTVLDDFPATLPGDPLLMLRLLSPLRPHVWSNPYLLMPSLAYVPDALFGDFSAAVSTVRVWTAHRRAGTLPPSFSEGHVAPSAATPAAAPRPNLFLLPRHRWTETRIPLPHSGRGASPFLCPPGHKCPWIRARAHPCTMCPGCGRISPFLEMATFVQRCTARPGGWAWAPVWWNNDTHALDPRFNVVRALMYRLSMLDAAHEQLVACPQDLVPESLRRAVGAAMAIHMPLAMAVEERGSVPDLCTDRALGTTVLLTAYPHYANPNAPPHAGSAPDVAEELPTLFSAPPGSDAWYVNMLPKARPTHLAARNIMPRIGNELWSHPEDDFQNLHLHTIAHFLLPSLTGDVPGARYAVGLALRLKYARLLRPTPDRPHLYGRFIGWINQHALGLHTNQVVVFVNQELLVSSFVDVLASQVDAVPATRRAMGSLFDWASWCAMRRGSADHARRWADRRDRRDMSLAHVNLHVHVALYTANHTSAVSRRVLTNHPQARDVYSLLASNVQQRMSGRDHSSARFKPVPTVIKGVVRLYKALAECPSLRDFRRAIGAMRAAGLQIRQFIPTIVYHISKDPEDVRVLREVEANPGMSDAQVLACANRMSDIGVGVFKLLTAPRANRLKIVVMQPSWGRHQRAAVRARYNIRPGAPLPAVYTTWYACLACGKMGREVVTFDAVCTSIRSKFPALADEWATVYTSFRNPNGGSANHMPYVASSLRSVAGEKAKRRRSRKMNLIEFSTTASRDTPLPAQRLADWERASAAVVESRHTPEGVHSTAREPALDPDPDPEPDAGDVAALAGRALLFGIPRDAGAGSGAGSGAGVPSPATARKQAAGKRRKKPAAKRSRPRPRPRPRARARARAGGAGVPGNGAAPEMGIQDILDALEESMGLAGPPGAEPADGVDAVVDAPPAAVTTKRRRLNVLSNEGSNDVCVKLCEECGNMDWLRKDCEACSHRGVAVVCNRKYHGGRTHSKRHCEAASATLIALGTKVVLHGETYMICPQPGCGLPAHFDPASAIWGEDMCALCHFKRFCAQRERNMPVQSLTHQAYGHMACIRCGTLAKPRARFAGYARTKSPVPGWGYTFRLADNETKRIGWRLVCWRCWHRFADTHVANAPLGSPIYAGQLVALLHTWNRTKFNRALKRSSATGVAVTGRALRDKPLGVSDLDGHSHTVPWHRDRARRTFHERCLGIMQTQAEDAAAEALSAAKRFRDAQQACI